MTKLFFMVFVMVIFFCACKQPSREKHNINHNIRNSVAEVDMHSQADCEKTKLHVIGSNMVDLGQVIQGTIISQNFLIANIGSSPLMIYDYWASCNCTELSIDKEIILPGDTCTLIMSLDTTNKIGKSRVSAKIKTNSGIKYHIFKILCEVNTELKY